MAVNRVVEGRMVTPDALAELIHGASVMAADPIEDADVDCPDCGGSVIAVGYMPDVTSFVTGYKCQDCPWAEERSD